jgi:hypothetical protein
VSRDLTAGVITELDAANLRPVIFYEGVFSGGTLRLWSGVGSITWNSQSWTGAGQLLGISAINETADIRAEGITLSLSGLPSALISSALAQAQLGLAGSVWLGVMTAAGAIIADPYMAFKGKLDVPSIEDNGDTCTISISYENQLIDLERARIRRWTHDDQQIDYPGDRGFEYMPTLQDQVLQF